MTRQLGPCVAGSTPKVLLDQSSESFTPPPRVIRI